MSKEKVILEKFNQNTLPKLVESDLTYSFREETRHLPHHEQCRLRFVKIKIFLPQNPFQQVRSQFRGVSEWLYRFLGDFQSA